MPKASSPQIVKPPAIRKPSLRFRYLANCSIYLGTGDTFTIPCTMVSEPNPNSDQTRSLLGGHRDPQKSTDILKPVFDLTHVFTILLADEAPKLPPQTPGMSEAYHSKQCDEAFADAIGNKRANDEIRRRVAHYVAEGILELVSDDFAGEIAAETPAESKPAKVSKPRKKSPRKKAA